MSPFNQEHQERMEELKLQERYPKIFQEGYIAGISGEIRVCPKPYRNDDGQRQAWLAGYDKGKAEKDLKQIRKENPNQE